MLINKRQSRQPSGAFKLRAEIGFDSFILPGVGADLVTGAPVVMGAESVLSQGAVGTAAVGTGTSTPTMASIANGSTFMATTSATIVYAGKLIARFNTGGGSIGQFGGGSQLGAYIPYSDGKVYWDFGGYTEGTNRLSVAGLSFSDSDVFVFTVGARGMEIWQNGIKRASNSATPTSTIISTAFGVHQRSNAGGTDRMRTYAFGYARKQLPTDVCAELSRDLWGTAFVQRRRGIVAGIAAAARRRVVFWG